MSDKKEKKIEGQQEIVTKEDLQRQELALKMNQVLISSLFGMRRNVLSLSSALKTIRDQELFLELDYENFAQYLASPEICLKPSTVNNVYIPIYEYWIEEKKKKIEDLQGIDMNKLAILKGVKNPDKYFEDAKTLAFSDFRKLIYKKEHGVESEDKEVEKYIEKKKSSCPHWDSEKKICKIGKSDPAHGKKNKDDDLL